MVTLPKIIDPGVTPRVPLVVVVFPVPVRDAVTDGSDALDVSASVAVFVPGVVGAKVTDRLALAPAARTYGNVNPLTVKPLPFKVAPEIVTLEPPEFETANACVWLLPTATVPRFRLEGTLR